MRHRILLLAVLLGPVATARAAPVAEYNLGTAMLTLDNRGVARLKYADGATWPAAEQSCFWLRKSGRTLLPRTVWGDESRLIVSFPDEILAEFKVTVQQGFVVFRLTRLTGGADIERMALFRLGVPEGATVRGVLNAATAGANTAAVMACEPNVRAFSDAPGVRRADRPGCIHQFTPTDEAKQGRTAALFVASADAKPGGWSMCGRSLDTPLDLSGLTAVRAWVHGDGQGQLLKFQLCDAAGGCRDAYLKIDFTGWKQVTLTDRPYDTLNYRTVTALQLYYNALPPGRRVACRIDQVEAVVRQGGKERTILLEDFEADDSPLWSTAGQTLCVETLARHGIQPAAFGVIACPNEKLWEVMPRLETAAGLPSPRLGGVWNKQSPWVKRSYLFLTSFGEAQLDEALRLARRGGFDLILLGQESWCEATGHYRVNRKNFPDGLDGLKRTVRRFKDAGFRVGFHFLGPSIYPPDRYLTPVPDPRLVKGAAAKLAADVTATADFLPLTAAPAGFPAEDGGYEGDGTVLQVGDELIHYGGLAPAGFHGCRRGHLGTKPAAHAKGTPVRHLKRSYGYHLFDMDTTLLDEAAGHFAAVADACDIDMIYFDGSERLQGDHWYYNARLHKAFHDRLKKKDLLLQVSSFSHYSWHLLARTASADGHGDLKGYLEERSPAFAAYALQGMPMDVGWYYGYDPNATPDQFEYVLGTTLGYGASMSFQVSVDAAKRHPFTGEILDLIARYERRRLAGLVSEEMRARLRIDPNLAGVKTPQERDKLLPHRRDYRLISEGHREVFQRVVYTPWRDVASDAGGEWTVEVPARARLGFQVHLPGGPWLAPGPSYLAADAVLLEGFEDLAPFTTRPTGGSVRVIEHGQGGSTLAGVRQRLVLHNGGKEGGRYAVYTAASTRDGPDGWSVLGRTFATPLDLSGHAGIGLWLRGDGRGGLFKLQLGDGKGAADYYLANDYKGWRYHQLPRPKVDPIDYGKVRTLMVYYNALPGKTTVACGIDGIKALRRLDRQTLADPWVEVGGQKLSAAVTLTEGQYLLVWPGELVRRHAPATDGQAVSDRPAPVVDVEAGRHAVRFGHAGARTGPLRVRVTLQPPERHPLP